MPPITRKEFAAKVKAKYPQYSSIDDNELVNKMVAKYPEYKVQISDFDGAPAEVKKKEPTAGGVAPKPSAFSAPVFGPLAQSVSDPKKVLSVPVASKGQPKTKYTPEQIKNYGGQVLAETQQRLSNTGFDPNQSAQLLDDNVLNSVLNRQRDLSAQSFSQRFADLSRFRLASDQQLPKVQLPAGVEAPKQKTFELEAQQVEREFKADVKKRQADIAVMRGIEIAKRNPTESPRVIGTEILKVADPDTYAIWEKTGFANRNIARQAEELGVQALAATGDDNAARLAAEDLSTMDDRFPEQKIAIARQMIAAKAYEDAGKAGALMGKRWTVEEMDKYAQQLPEDYREVYEKHIRPTEEKMGVFGTFIPNWGLAKFAEGAGALGEEIGKPLASAMNIRTEADVNNEILNAPTETRYSFVGESPAIGARKQELQYKKENGLATAKDIYELEELIKTENARGAAQRFLDAAAFTTGNVVGIGVVSRALGTALNAVARGLGVTASEAQVGLKGLDAIAETATNFGLRQSAFDTAGLLAAGYAASDNSNAKAALQLFPDDKDTDKRTAYKQVMNWANAASELVFRDTKVLDAFKRTVSPKIVTFVSQLSKGQIDNLAAKETVKGILREGFQVAKAAGANINQDAVEELLPVVTDAVATGVLAPDKLDVGGKFKEAWDTYMTMLVDGSVVGLVGGVRDYRQNRVALPFMSKLGRAGFEDFTTAIQTEIARQEVQGELTAEQAQEKRAIIQAFTAANESAATNPALQDKPQREIDKYVALDAKARVLAEKVQTVAEADTVAAEIIAEQVNETEQAKADLLSDSTVVTEEGGIVPANEAPIEEDLTKISTAESRKAALKEAVRAAFPQTPTNEPTTTEANQPTTEIEGATNPQQIEAGTPAGVQPSIGDVGQGGTAGNVAVGGNGSAIGERMSDEQIEKRMSEIEGANFGTTDAAEFNALEKEMEKRERASVFDVPLEKVNDAVDALMKKEKEKPNGYGAFIEKRDARETKEVADRYLNAKKLTDAELKKDFSDALRGNPTTWYADGLKLRESLKEATRRGIDTKEMLAKVARVYTDAGYDAETAKSVVANMLKPIFEGSQKVNEKQIAEQAVPSQPIPQSQAEPAGNVAEQPIPQQGDTVTVISKTDGKPINYTYKNGDWYFTDSRGKGQKESTRAQKALTLEWQQANGILEDEIDISLPSKKSLYGTNSGSARGADQSILAALRGSMGLSSATPKPTSSALSNQRVDERKLAQAGEVPPKGASYSVQYVVDKIMNGTDSISYGGTKQDYEFLSIIGSHPYFKEVRLQVVEYLKSGADAEAITNAALIKIQNGFDIATLNHEMMHILTVGIMESPDSALTQPELEFKREIFSIIKEIDPKYEALDQIFMGYERRDYPFELIAEAFTGRDASRFLQKKTVQRNRLITEEKIVKIRRNLLQKVIDAIKRLFGGTIEKTKKITVTGKRRVTISAYEAISAAFEKVSDTPAERLRQLNTRGVRVFYSIPGESTDNRLRVWLKAVTAQFPDATSEEIMAAISEDAPQLVATEGQQQAVREMVDEAVLGAGNVFAAIDAANTKRSINARNAAKTQVREKYGEEAAKAMDINSNFDKYIAQLKDTGVIEKVICQ